MCMVALQSNASYGTKQIRLQDLQHAIEIFIMAQKYIIAKNYAERKLNRTFHHWMNYGVAVSNFLSISQCGVWYANPHWRRCISTLQFCVIIE